MAFYKSCVYRITNCRVFYRSLKLSFAAKDSTQINLNHSPLSASFMNSGICQAFCQKTPRTFGVVGVGGGWRGQWRWPRLWRGVWNVVVFAG
jgi:hypothetical protein